MFNSMTGFGAREKTVPSLGKVSVELRSSNHKFLDIVYHMPEGFLSLEDKFKNEISGKVKRGRITCSVNIAPEQGAGVIINKELIKRYLSELKKIRSEFGIDGEINLNTLIHLPNVLSVQSVEVSKDSSWPFLKALFNQALDDLVKMRQKEGRGLQVYLKARAASIKTHLEKIEVRFKIAIRIKLARLTSDEERSSFLKSSDIGEEVQRLEFHVRNFIDKLSKSGPVGKELDFIAQEMQRETNTIGAKSCDVLISSRVVNIKSQIEKIREQLQNVE